MQALAAIRPGREVVEEVEEDEIHPQRRQREIEPADAQQGRHKRLVAHGRDREEARRKLLSAVRHCVLLGLPSNQGFLADGLSDAVFVQGTGVHTGFVAERMGLPPAAPVPSTRTVALAALAAQVHNLPCDAQGHLQAADQLIERDHRGVLETTGHVLPKTVQFVVQLGFGAHHQGLRRSLDGVQLLGGHGFTKEHPVERWYRDLRATAVMHSGLHA